MDHDLAVRYARHLSLPQLGESGQRKLMDARVLVIGAGGLGSPVLLYLAAAGVGTLGIVDDDRVALSNLQRQILHETGDVHRPKVESACDTLHELNPEVLLEPHAERLTEDNVDTLLKPYDIIADGSDNFETRFLLNDRCHALQKTLVSAAILGFAGQLYTFKSHLGAPHPCYRCLVPNLPPAGSRPRCAESGVLGSVAGTMGSWQATEIIKELTGVGESLSGQMIIYDALTTNVRKTRIPRDPQCSCCG